MNILITYFSRTGTTRTIAEDLSALLKTDLDPIIESKPRSGPLGYLKSGKEAMNKSLPEISTKFDPFQYDLVIIGTPIWVGNISSPIRTYLTKNKFKQVAFFCTEGTFNHEKAFEEMKTLTKRPVATLFLKTSEVKQLQYAKKVDEFIKKIKLL